ncbi:MAG: AAA family ATPase [Nitrososphaerota archaeon]|nr:AAA family ATPase [Nitrososphaerota archaeon]
MKFKFLEISNYLSFGPTHQRIEFDNDLTVFIGPNGGGKTNIIRAIDTVRDVITSTVSRAWNYPVVTPQTLELQNRTHFAHQDKPSEITLGVDFSSEIERMEIESFIRAAIISSLYESWMSNNQLSLDEKNDLIAMALASEIPGWLTSGCIHLQHGARSSDQWQLSYSTGPESKVTFEWLLSGPYFSYMSVLGATRSSQPTTPTIGSKFRQSGSDGVSFDDLMPSGNELVQILVQNYNLLNLIREFPVVGDLYKRLESYNWYPMVDAAQRAYGFHHVLDSLFQTKVFSDAEDAPLGHPLEVTAESLAIGNAPIFSVKKARIPRYLEQLYRWQNGAPEHRARFLRAQGIFGSFRNGENFGLRLSPGRTNSPSVENATMAAGQQATEVTNQNPILKDWFTLIPFVERLNEGRKTNQGPLQEVFADQAGSGVAELIRLSTFLASEPDSVVLLDEPMARLHPTLQKRFIENLQNAEAQYIVTSHAPGLFPSKTNNDDYSNLAKRVALDENLESRVYSLPSLTGHSLHFEDNGHGDQPLVKAAFAQGLRSKVAKEFAAEPSVLGIPFVERLVLLSGQSEFVAYQAWYSQYSQNKAASDVVHFHLFGADDHLDVLLAIAMAFNVPWVAIVDGGSFKPTGEIDGIVGKVPLVLGQIATAAVFANRNDVIEKVKKKASMVAHPNDRDKSQWMESARPHLESFGVYTFANCWNPDGSIDLTFSLAP